MDHVGIVIVNWNTRDLLRDCLRSLQAGDPSVTRHIIVVDNASSDGSADMVRAEFPSVEVIANPVNGGVSQANNLGLKARGFDSHRRGKAEAPRYALLLKPDTVVPPDAACPLIQRAEDGDK